MALATKDLNQMTATNSKVNKERLNFTLLPGFASFLKEKKLHEYVVEQIRLSKEVDVPLLRFFKGMSDEQLIEMSKVSSGKFLTYMAENNAAQLIEESLRQWITDQLPQVGRYHVTAEDIPLVSYVRKQALLSLLPEYSSDPQLWLGVIKEIDSYLLESDSATFHTYIDLLDERLNEHLHFIEKIADTTPGIIYVFDLKEKRIIYSNGKTKELLGYGREEMENLAAGAPDQLMHPEDLEKMKRHMEEFETAADEEIRSIEYRIKAKAGLHKWARNYETVFKRNEDGTPAQIIGITLDIEKEKKMAEELVHREEQLLEAQDVAEMGSYRWDLTTDKYEVTPQLAKILELKDHSELPHFMSRIHPSDKPIVKQAIDTALAEGGVYDCEFRFEGKEAEKVIWSRGYVTKGNGKGEIIKGTIMDVTARHHMVRRLKRSEDLYKQAQALTHLGNWTWEINKNKITWTDEMYRIFGLEPQSEEITVNKLLAYLKPKDQEFFLQTMNYLQQSKSEGEYYPRITLKDGTVKTLNVKAEVLFDENNVAYKILGTAQDVTEQKLSESKLRENQNFLKKIADATPSIIAAYNTNTGKYLFINQAIEKLLGYSRQQVLDEGAAFFADKIHPDDIGALMEKNANALELANQDNAIDTNEIIVEFKYRMRHKNGNYRWFHTYGTIFDRNESKKVEHILNISHDITAQVEAENKVAEQEHLIQHIAEASPAILCLFDVKQDCIIYINKEITPVLGYTPKEVLAMGSEVRSLLFHPSDRERIAKMLPSKNNDSEIVEYECRMCEKDKGWRWLLVREISFQEGSDGKPSRVLCAALDISERKDIELQLQQKSLELEQSNANLEEFAYVASHDLKEPLRKISSFGDRLMFKEKDKLSVDGKNFLEKMIDSSQRMQRMIDDLLSISMISGDKAFEKCNLQNIVDEVSQTLEFKIEEKNAVIKSDGLPEATIIISQFRQLFQNLISNSLKFSRNETPPVVSITHRYVKAGDLEKVYLPGGIRHLQVTFTDNGIGFDEKYSEKIFSIFHRLHGRSEYEGTGIGLAICKKIVENHGGKIYATGEENKGAEFNIIIPV